VRELLAEGLRRLGIEHSTEQLEALERYRQELERWNRRYGFVKASGRELVVRHFLDSLAGLPVLRGLSPLGTVLDVGSGAGFPGLPLALFLPGAQVVLLERSERRAAFLDNVVLLLGLRNVEVLRQDLRRLRRLPAGSRRFELVTFRAFTPLARELASLRAVLAPAGHIAAYKGRHARIAAELAEAGLGPGVAEVVRLEVPFLGEERHLVIIR
jgi:16S rRNA (guanine527-N7)-methyltransferase